MSSRELRVLHIAANYPDNVFKQPTTKAVQNLVMATASNLNHYVISIARVRPFAPLTRIRSETTLSIAYHGLPLVLGAKYSFSRLAKQIAFQLGDELSSFDVVHAHKLSVEGIVAWLISMQFGMPLLTTVRGFTDVRILKCRPDLRRLYGQILSQSSAVFLPAPWLMKTLRSFAELDSEAMERSGKCLLLPNVVELESEAASKVPCSVYSTGRICAIFRDGQGRAKGFYKILNALDQADSELHGLELDVIGCSNKSIEAEYVRARGINSRVKFLGKMPHSEVQRKLQDYDALVLPSESETFGMSYIEAIFSGVPIMYSAGTGVDGYFDDMKVGVRVDSGSQLSITNGLVQLVKQCSEFKNSIRYLHSQKRFDNFSATSISEVYRGALVKAHKHSRRDSINCGGLNESSK